MNLIKPVLAAPGDPVPTPIGDLCSGGGLGPFAEFLCKLTPAPGNEPNNATAAVGALAFLISNIIAVFTVVAGLVFIIQFLIGGFNWLTSSGDKAKLETAQQKLINSVVGLVIVVSAYALVSLVGAIVGIDILINDPGALVDRLRP